MFLHMWPSRTKVLFGLAVCGVALEMITDPPLFVGLTLLMLGAFLAFWGLEPQQLLRGLQRIPGHEILIGWIMKFDDWFEELAGATAYDANVASRLHALYARGRDIQAEDPAALGQALASWSQEVTSFLDEYLPNETFLFQTYPLERRPEKLRLIIGRYENLQWRGGRE
jgi:hypothetical protein